MTLHNWPTLIAIIVGPILAVQAQAWIEKKSQKKKDRSYIFTTLMSTRADPLALEHVRALNMLPIIFYKETSIENAFSKYIKHLTTSNQSKDTNDDEREKNASSWVTTKDDLLCDLLQKIGKTLNYDFDIDQIKNFSYTPAAHVNLVEEQAKLRKSFIELTEGKSAININTIYNTDQREKQKELFDNLNNLLSGKRAILVRDQLPENTDEKKSL